MKLKSTNIGKINKLIHEPARLYIMSALIKEKSAKALLLKSLTGLSWGNLSVQLTKLERVGYIRIIKRFYGRKPETLVKITPKGRDSYKKYLKILRKHI